MDYFWARTIQIYYNLKKINKYLYYLLLSTSYYRGWDIVVIVYDITNRNSFDNIKEYIERVELYSRDDVTVFIWGNKTDENAKRVVTTEEGLFLSEKYHACFIEASAKDDTNIEELFMLLASSFIEKINSKYP